MTSLSCSDEGAVHNPEPLRLRHYNRLHRRCQDEICPQVRKTWLVPVTPYEPRDVLINNWVEDRSQYTRVNYPHNSTYRLDFKPPQCPLLDEVARRRAKLRNEGGLPLKHFFHHDLGPKNQGGRMITVYDEQYSRKKEWLESFPEERTWSVALDEWRPEKNDFPLKAEPTNWGLLERLEAKWRRQKDAETCDPRRPDYRTIYYRSYGAPCPLKAYTLTRYATPQVESISHNVVDKINKNIAPYDRTIQPELMPRLEPSGASPGACRPLHPPPMLHS